MLFNNKYMIEEFFLIAISLTFWKLWYNLIMDLNYSMKIMIIGDESVGKSNFMAYFTDNDFNCNYIATIGIDLRVKIIEIGNRSRQA